MPRPRYRSPRNDGQHADAALPLETLCVVIPRQSTLGQGASHVWSDEKHPDEMAAYARTLGFTRIQVLTDDMGVGAYKTTIEERRALQYWLRHLLPSGESKVVLVSQEDRLFRDESEIEHNRFIAEVRQHGGWVVCMVNGHIYNFRRDFDREQFRQMCKFGKQYVEVQVIGRMHPAAQRAAMRGRYVGGYISWGYIVDYRDPHSPTFKHYMPYAPHADLVADKVFRRFADDRQMALVELQRSWAREGQIWPAFGPEVDARTVRMFNAHCHYASGHDGGYRFTRLQARHILTDITYLGWRFRAGELARDEHGDPKLCHEPLVDPDLFWWCFDRLMPARPAFAPPRTTVAVPRFRPRRSSREHTEPVRFLAHGLVRCAAHQRPMVLHWVETNTSQTTDIRCRRNEQEELDLGPACLTVRAPLLEDALCRGFTEQLTLDERDIQELAAIAERRAHGPARDVALLERELAEHIAAFTAAKEAILDAKRHSPELAEDFFEDMRKAKAAMRDTHTKLEAAKQTGTPSIQAWAKAQRAMGWADRIRSTFMDWSRPAKAKVLGLALEDAIVGRVRRDLVGIWMRWYGGAVSQQEIVRANGGRLSWSSEEDAALRAHFATLSHDALQARLPGRPFGSIWNRAYKMGLKRSTEGLFLDDPPIVVPTPEMPNEMAAFGFPLARGAASAERAVIEAIGAGRSAPAPATSRPVRQW